MNREKTEEMLRQIKSRFGDEVAPIAVRNGGVAYEMMKLVEKMSELED